MTCAASVSCGEEKSLQVGLNLRPHGTAKVYYSAWYIFIIVNSVIYIIMHRYYYMSSYTSFGGDLVQLHKQVL